MPDNPLFADVILPLPLPKLYTYSVPENIAKSVEPGKRVVVQFGKKKIYTAIVRQVHSNKPTGYETKALISVLDEKPIINEIQFQFWEWIADYYLCNLGDVFKAALPSGLKLESETKIFYNHNFAHKEKLTEKEELIINVLVNRNVLSIKEVSSLIEQKYSLPVIKSLHEKNAIFIEETLKDTYKPKFITYVKLNKEINNEEKLHQIFNQLEKAPKQLNLLMNYIKLSKIEVEKKVLLESIQANAQTFNALIKKNIFEVYQRQADRLKDYSGKTSKSVSLNEHQKNAYVQIKDKFQDSPCEIPTRHSEGSPEKTGTISQGKDVVLLYGVTSSGKTEIYIHLISEYIKKGSQVLYLLPEIALTTQIISRLRQVFGNKVGVYHSKFSDAERVEVWKNVLKNNKDGKCQIILGVRSSIFLPFNNLGLVIIDEEHENTYKQFDPAPRYHARDAAIILAKLHGAKTLLGTATPSIESYFNSQTEKYGLVELNQRYKNIQLPETIIANTKEAYRKRQMKSHFTPVLLENIDNALKNKEQVILFQNRRGFSSYLECSMCGWIPYCKQCNVSLTYHKHLNRVVCHYCGYSQKNPNTCDACGSTSVQTRSFGTEKIEDEIPIFFPDAKVSRMDLDSTRSKKSYQKIISDFETKKIDILIGTQMVSKGLDFDNVSIVGIMDADNMLYFPDFRAFERGYQLMAQVSGRAGRKNKRGKVIIQTSNPEHTIIKDVINNNYLNMYKSQCNERKKIIYPPFCRLIKITLKHKKQDVLNDAAKILANDLKTIFGKRVLGPEFPVVNKIQNWYLKNIILKIEKQKSSAKAKGLLLNSVNKLKTKTNYKSLQIICDVDPM